MSGTDVPDNESRDGAFLSPLVAASASSATQGGPACDEHGAFQDIYDDTGDLLATGNFTDARGVRYVGGQPIAKGSSGSTAASSGTTANNSGDLPLHRTAANVGVSCSTCDGGGCPDCTDPA